MAKLAAILLVLVVLGGLPAQAALFETKLTSEGLGLGLGNVNVNHGGTVHADILGKLITSSNIGEGSILYINTAGTAGTVADPLFVTVTAQTRLDVTGLPTTDHDYQAGVLTISKEDDTLLDGAKEGLGVKAFTVDASLMRVKTSGLANIEGSKHISGGSEKIYDGGTKLYGSLAARIEADKVNGAPHVDEAVTFDFNPLFYVDAQSVVVLLSVFESTDIIDLNIELTLGSSINEYDETFMQTTAAAIEDADSGDDLWRLNFDNIVDLKDGDLVKNFTIYANDDNIHKHEHFWITGMKADFEPVPVPGAVILGVIGIGFSSLLGRRKFSV